MPIGSFSVLWRFSDGIKQLSDLAFPGVASLLPENHRLFTIIGVQYFDKPKLNPLYNFKATNMLPSLVPWTSVQRFAADTSTHELSEAIEKGPSAADMLAKVAELLNSDWRTLNLTQVGVGYDTETKTQEIELLGSATGVGVSLADGSDLALPGLYPNMDYFINKYRLDEATLRIEHNATAGFAQAATEDLLGGGSIAKAVGGEASAALRPEQVIHLGFEQGELTAVAGNSKVFPSQFWLVLESLRQGENLVPRTFWYAKHLTDKDSPLSLINPVYVGAMRLERNPLG